MYPYIMEGLGFIQITSKKLSDLLSLERDSLVHMQRTQILNLALFLLLFFNLCCLANKIKGRSLYLYFLG